MTDVFLSVGKTFNPRQELFVREIERLLNEHSLRPRALGRNEWSADQPLRAIRHLMDECDGAVVVAFERLYLVEATDQRGGAAQRAIRDQFLPTVWNHIEAAMANAKGLPLLVMAERGIVPEGMLEGRHDWYVQEVSLEPAELRTAETLGRLAAWAKHVEASHAARNSTPTPPVMANPANMTVVDLVGALRPAQLWALISAAAGILAGAFLLGRQLAP
jgi:hypothetical protein